MKLALFFTYGVSFKDWIDAGLFDREKEIYEAHLRNGDLKKVYWLTYGKYDNILASEMKLSGRLHADIDVLSMPRFFCGSPGRFLYSLLICFVYRDQLKQADILKTNQMNGGWSAVIAKKMYGKPLIARMGYVLSLLARKISRLKIKNIFFELIERFVCGNADTVVVSSERDKHYICSKYGIPAEKVKVLYNYINTSFFRPLNCEKYSDRIVFVGRITYEKNLFNLLEAISACGFTLDIFGEGKLRRKLEREAEKLNARVNFMGIVPNNELPRILNRYYYYILPSFFDNMPKALLEAMACGLVCIATDIDGINEVIKDGVNGYLARDARPGSLIEAIKKAAQKQNDLIAKEATQTIYNNFSLEKFIEREKGIINALAS
jgi:glycosyltransferase involved in cell wall biosynthesis